jgi:hypothetical protein
VERLSSGGEFGWLRVMPYLDRHHASPDATVRARPRRFKRP